MTLEELLSLLFLFLFALLIIALGLATIFAYRYLSLRAKIPALIHNKYADWQRKEVDTIRAEQAEAMHREATVQFQQWRAQELETIRKEQEEIARQNAMQQLQQWRGNEIDSIRQAIHEDQVNIARREAAVQLEQWKDEQEKIIRQDAIQKSQSVTFGKITEHFIPYLPHFKYNPKDARFIGSPVDLIVFDGLNDGELRDVVFIEVKTGVSNLSTRERQIRDAVRSGRVQWLEIRPSFDIAGKQADGGELQDQQSAFVYHESAILDPQSRVTSQKISGLVNGRLPIEALDKCPHGIPKIQKCAICDPEGWRAEHGWD